MERREYLVSSSLHYLFAKRNGLHLSEYDIVNENETTIHFLEQSLQQHEHLNLNNKETRLTCRKGRCLYIEDISANTVN
jgi:hypothetical protein